MYTGREAGCNQEAHKRRLPDQYLFSFISMAHLLLQCAQVSASELVVSSGLFQDWFPIDICRQVTEINVVLESLCLNRGWGTQLVCTKPPSFLKYYIKIQELKLASFSQHGVLLPSQGLNTQLLHVKLNCHPKILEIPLHSQCRISQCIFLTHAHFHFRLSHYLQPSLICL